MQPDRQTLARALDAVVKKAQAAYANFQRVLRGEPPLNTVRPYAEVVKGGRS